MLRHLTQPFNARVFQGHIGVKAAGDGVVDEGLLLFGQECYQLPLGLQQSVHSLVHIVQVADDGGLLLDSGGRGNISLTSAYVLNRKSDVPLANPV